MTIQLTPAQNAVIALKPDAFIFLEGPAGCGKTTAAAQRLLTLLSSGIPAGQALILTPRRNLAAPYLQALNTPGAGVGGSVTNLTIGGLARRMLELFFPLVAREAGFAHPDAAPIFLTQETAQYFMARIVRPLLAEGYFETLVMDRNRLFTQILDGLDKSAVVGFPHTEIGERLSQAWNGEKNALRSFKDAQECATRFRAFCLENNLLDFSLQLEVFRKHLWQTELCRDYLNRAYRHIIVDNLEEESPLTHDFLTEWLPELDSALLVYDHDAGYRRFTGADPDNALTLKALCPAQNRVRFDQSFVAPVELIAFAERLAQNLTTSISPCGGAPQSARPARARIRIASSRFYPDMLDWAAHQADRLIREEGLPPEEIVILAPYMNDVLRFSLFDRLAHWNVAARSHRPSRSLREETVVLSLVALMAAANPAWGFQPDHQAFAYALVDTIEGMDVIRAQLLSSIVYRSREGIPALLSFDPLKEDVKERITYLLGERYERLRKWLAENGSREDQQPDHFLSRMFGEVLSQPGFRFHSSTSAGEVTANLIESIQKFRWAAGDTLRSAQIPLGKEYIEMMRDGVIAAQYVRSWRAEEEEGTVLVAPAYTFLMRNRPVAAQIWLDIGSSGWSERLEQPLTHPYVLNRSWEETRLWTNQDETRANQEALSRLVSGLVRRCSGSIYLGLSEVGERGYENQSLLLRTLDQMIRQNPADFEWIQAD